MTAQNQPAVAYSYLRFSNDEQADGDSLRRQSSGAAGWCERNGVALDASLSLRDLGVSAFKGRNATHGALSTFLDLIKNGRVPPGSYLIVENVDRISRQGIDEGYDYCKRILKAGVHIVTLFPERVYGPGAVKGLMKGALELQILLELAAEESKKKSERLSAVWGEKKRQAAREGRKLGLRVPGWIRAERDGGGGGGVSYHLVPERAAIVRRIFALAGSGYGVPAVIAALERDEVATFGGRSTRWCRAYVNLILKDRRCLGEYQPMKGKEKDGPVIPDYYPAVVTADEYHAARAGAAQRRRSPGRTGAGAAVNVFAGLLKEARHGDAYRLSMHRSKTAGVLRRRIPILKSAGEDSGRPTYSIPYLVVEGAVTRVLREIDPAEVDAGSDRAENGADARAVEGQLAEALAEVADLVGQCRKKATPSLLMLLAEKETQAQELAARLEAAAQSAACPASRAWRDVRTLADVIAGADDQRDARLRLRAALRRVVEGMCMLVVRVKRDALAAVQVRLAGGLVRDLVVWHRPAGARREEGWDELSLADVIDARDLDLRDRAQAATLAAALGGIDPKKLTPVERRKRGCG